MSSIGPIQTFPVELLHHILKFVDARTIYFSFRHVCTRFRRIVNRYHRYDELDFEFMSKAEMKLICRVISPQYVRSLTLSDNIMTPNQIKLFCSVADIRQFVQLHSLTLVYFNESDLKIILQSCINYSITSLSIKIQSVSHQFENPIPKCLSSIIALSTLRKLYLHTCYRIDEASWPVQCLVQILTIDRCTLDQYCTILRRSPFLRVIIVNNCHSIMERTQGIDFSALDAVSFEQLKSLTLKNINNLTMEKLEFLLSLTISIEYIQLTSQAIIFDNSRWEQLITKKLRFLEKFQFFFSQKFSLYNLSANIKSLIAPFQTPFWLDDRRWFITCDYIKVIHLIKIYSTPVCVSDFEYVVESNKISYSTNVITDNNETIMDNVRALKLDMIPIVTDAATIKEKIESSSYPLFRKVNKLELRIKNQWPTDSFHYLSTLLYFSHLNVLQLCFSFDIPTGIISFLEQAPVVHTLEIRNYSDDDEYKTNMGNVCLIVPRHVKQLDVKVNSFDDMKTILERLDHLSSVVFRFSTNLSRCSEQVIEWLERKEIDFTYQIESTHLSIWLGKKKTPLPTIKIGYNRAKVLHRYDDF